MWLAHVGALVAGLVVLGGGGEFLVRGASRLAKSLGVSPLVVGLTVVAFGTSAPEAAVTIFATIEGTAPLAIGNIVGSNIANILLILGFAAAVSPLKVSASLIRVDGPIMILVAALFLGLAVMCGQIPTWAGIVFVVCLVFYTLLAYAIARRSPIESEKLGSPETGVGRRWWHNLLAIGVGIVGLVAGARLIVYGATKLALLLGVDDHIVGLTIVAIGTSLPELATAAVAARHKQPDIAIGNVVGSNIFNILFVTGIAAMIRPLDVPVDIVRVHGPLMLAVCVLFYPLVRTGQRVTRQEGVLLLVAYAGYLAWTGSRVG